MSRHRLAIAALALMAVSSTALAQGPAPRPDAPPARATLVYKNDWRPNAKGAEGDITPTATLNADVELKTYGPQAHLRIGGRGDNDVPTFLFSGLCQSACAFTLRHKASLIDLSSAAYDNGAPGGRVRINSKVSGFHRLYPIVKLADGSWWIGDRPVQASTNDWTIAEVVYGDMRWTKLEIDNLLTRGRPVDKIDLAKVDEIGFADLMAGSGHGPGGWFSAGAIEVYGKAVAR